MPDFSSLSKAVRAIQNDTKRLNRGLQRATKKAARSGVSIARREVPVAFGELRDSLSWDDIEDGHSQVVADAPHAAAVEFGSRPHWAPIGPLVAWVKLRGMQGISGRGKVRKTATPQQHRVASQLAAMSRNGSNAVGDPYAIAKAIQRAIAVNGTKPHFYMRASVEPVADQFWTFVQAELSKAASE